MPTGIAAGRIGLGSSFWSLSRMGAGKHHHVRVLVG